MKVNHNFLQELLNAVSVSGYEEPVQDIVEKEMQGYAEEIIRDEMENLICVLNPDSKVRIMLSAHADEIGLMISNIKEDGTIQVIRRGGIVPGTYPGQQVKIINKRGTVYGVVEAYRELFDKSNLSTKDFVIDIGAKNREDALKYVELGDPIVLDTHIRNMANNKFSARALDDRLGVFIIMEALKRAKELKCKAGIWAASTVGEETTKTGAYWTSTRIKPDLAIVVDVTYTGDCIGMDSSEMGTVQLGAGPVLCNSPIVVKALNARMEACAKENKIPTQREAASNFSYTDGDKIHFSNEGVPMVLVSIPLRYMHMPCETADYEDVKNCIELIAQFISQF